MGTNEKDLLQKAKSGDVSAFEQLIGDYQKKVFNMALRMAGNYDDAAELAQEVFLRVYKSIAKFKEESSFSTWIYRITTNVCLDELRKRKNRKVIYLEEELGDSTEGLKRQLEDTSPAPEELVERKELQEVVKKAVSSLPELHRMMIIMRDIQGLSYEEIASALNCPAGTVKSRISRARLELREILKDKRELFKEDSVK